MRDDVVACLMIAWYDREQLEEQIVPRRDSKRFSQVQGAILRGERGSMVLNGLRWLEYRSFSSTRRLACSNRTTSRALQLLGDSLKVSDNDWLCRLYVGNCTVFWYARRSD